MTTFTRTAKETVGHVTVERWSSDLYRFELLSARAEHWSYTAQATNGRLVKVSRDYQTRAAALHAMRCFATGHSTSQASL